MQNLRYCEVQKIKHDVVLKITYMYDSSQKLRYSDVQNFIYESIQ